MNFQDYLKRLQAELKGLSPEEKALIVEEISAHFNEGQTDPSLGGNENKRLEKLSTEMGDPKDLGRRLKEIHHPQRWLEYLLIVVPEILLFPLLSGVVLILFPIIGSEPAANEPGMFLGIRASILLHVCLVITGFLLYKRQGLITSLLFWLSSLWLTIFALCFREKHWGYSSAINSSSGGILESIFWTMLLIGLTIGLSKILWERKDPLWFIFVSIPFLTALGNLATSEALISGGFQGGYVLPVWRIEWLGYSLPIWRIGGFGMQQIIKFIWSAIFIFSKQRFLRWIALFIYVTPFALMNLMASASYPYLVVIWILPILMIGSSWLFEIFNDKAKLRIIK